MNQLAIRSIPCGPPACLGSANRCVRVATPPLPIGRTSPEHPPSTAGPLRIVVVTSGLPGRSIHAGFENWLQQFRQGLPADSKIEVLCGTSSRATRLATTGIPSTMDLRETEIWLAQFRPDLLYYPRLEDLAFGVHPVMWNLADRIDLPRIWINLCVPPSSVRERLLIREMMIADGPTPPDTETTGRRRPPAGSGGVRWLIRGPDDARALEPLRPSFAQAPQFGRLVNVPGERSPFGPTAELAGYLLGGVPLGFPPLVAGPATGPGGWRLPATPLPIKMLPAISLWT